MEKKKFLTAEDIQKNKERYIELLKSTGIDGIDNLIQWMESKGAFNSWASMNKHGAYDGGLIHHSLNVYDALLVQYKNYLDLGNEDIYDRRTLIISALLHDLCKVDLYTKREIKNWKDDNGKWHSYYVYGCEDKFPVGHGEKSVIMAQNFIRLNANEIISIRWHMGTYDTCVLQSPYSMYSYQAATNDYPLVSLLQTADVYATRFFDYSPDLKITAAIS